MPEKKFADKKWASENQLTRKEIPITYPTSEGEETIWFEIQQLDADLIGELREKHIKIDSDTEDVKAGCMAAFNAAQVVHAITKPDNADAGFIHDLKTNKPSGVFETLLNEIQLFNGGSPKKSKNEDSPE